MVSLNNGTNISPSNSALGTLKCVDGIKQKTRGRRVSIGDKNELKLLTSGSRDQLEAG